MEILILFNIAKELKKGKPSDLDCEQEIGIIVPLVSEILRGKGYQVSTLETTYDLWEDLKLYKKRTDLVLNLAEGFGGTNANEPLVPAMLEALEIPFTGASSRNMHFTMDKEKTKLVLASHGVPVAPHQLVRSDKEVIRDDLRFPLIVKPVREEASVGVYADNVVSSQEDLDRKVRESLSLYSQPALVEKFITGREISVGIVGNVPSLHIFPPLEFLFIGAKSPLEKIRSYEYKWGGKKEQMVKAELPEILVNQLKRYTEIAFRETDCRDYARMDFRLDKNDNPYLLEVNYNPGIGPNTHGLNNTLTRMASFEGFGFEDFIESIVQSAARRYGLL
ncbi:MAG: D-alanine--D-alanine ligase [Candidatus Daviesbacteria bacterium]|nr:D-alanine--D-alanine ligase [Candidatus Daviesbacteria bacterium]